MKMQEDSDEGLVSSTSCSSDGMENSDMEEEYNSTDESSDDEREMVQRVRKGRKVDHKMRRLKSGICEKSH